MGMMELNESKDKCSNLDAGPQGFHRKCFLEIIIVHTAHQFPICSAAENGDL